MPWGTRAKERKKRARGVPRVHGDVGGEGKIEVARHKPAQDWVILRYHVLRIAVPMRVCVRLTVCTCTRRPSRSAPLSVFSFLPFFSGFLSFAGFFASLLSRSPFSHSPPPCPPSTHPPSRGRLARLLFAAGTRVSLAHTPRGRSFATRT